MMLETSAAQAQADRTRFTELRWMTAEGHWNHLVYDPSEEIMVVDPQKRPRPRAEVLKELERLIIIFKTPELILKYDSFRPLKGKLEGPLMTFQLELSLQSPVAHEAMQILRGWFGLSHMLLMGARVKPERAIRPHLAQALQQALFG